MAQIVLACTGLAIGKPNSGRLGIAAPFDGAAMLICLQLGQV